MEAFSALPTLCAEISPVTGEFPSQRPVTRSFDVLFDLRTNGWAHNGNAGDLGRHRAHNDVTVMSMEWREGPCGLQFVGLYGLTEGQSRT